jgi:predicted ATPase
MSDHTHAPTVATCTFFSAAWVALLAGDAEACEQHSADLVAFCTEKKVHQFRLFGGMTLASARSMREPTAQNIEALRSAIDDQHRSGAHLGDTLFLAQLGEALLRVGDLAGCEAALKGAFDFAEQFGERFWVPDLHRIEGVLRLEQADPKRAEAAFLKAIEVARTQEARMHELRAVVDLARLWRGTGSIHDPLLLLQHGLSEIEGGQNSRHVRAARSFLAELA